MDEDCAKTSQTKLLIQLSEKDRRIEELEQRVAMLTASHKALILAVGELRGMEIWKRFFNGYEMAKYKLEE